MPLGLVTSEATSTYWSQNSRRKIFYSYPNGTAPLTGFLSLGDSEDTPMSTFGWYEERWEQLKTLTSASGTPTANVVFYLSGTTTTAGTPVTFVSGTQYRIYVDDASIWQADDVVKIHRVPLTGGTQTELSFRVVSTNTTGADYIEAQLVAAPGTTVINNASTVTALAVIYSGSAFAEGSRSRSGRTKYPSNITNNTQIFKTAFELTRNALKSPLVYDKTGDYKNQLKYNGINHMAGMEWQFLVGDRGQGTDIDPDTGSTVRRTFTGGLLWYLKQWEKGSVSNGGAFDYRSNAVDVSGQTDFLVYPDKRIIRLGGTAVNADTFDEIEALSFQKTNSTEFCKLCLCGPGYMAKVNSRYRKEVVKTELRESQFDGWNFKVVMRSGLLGDIYYKTHPLFAAADSPYRNSAFYIDLGYIKYRYLSDTDTDIQQMIQQPDADKRKDQYLTEAGLEIPYPEAHQFVDQLGAITM